MKIDQIITAANKKEIRTSINDWLRSELNSEARSQCECVARQYLKENKAEIDTMIKDEMDKLMPKLTKEFVHQIKRNFNCY